MYRKTVVHNERGKRIANFYEPRVILNISANGGVLQINSSQEAQSRPDYTRKEPKTFYRTHIKHYHRNPKKGNNR